jgi:hypothetical protein
LYKRKWQQKIGNAGLISSLSSVLKECKLVKGNGSREEKTAGLMMAGREELQD